MCPWGKPPEPAFGLTSRSLPDVKPRILNSFFLYSCVWQLRHVPVLTGLRAVAQDTETVARGAREQW